VARALAAFTFNGRVSSGKLASVAESRGRCRGHLIKRTNHVIGTQPRCEAEGPEPRPAMLERIKQVLVTSRLTLAGETAGANPYDSRRGRDPGAVWGNRSR
jgi:hypothetical protein